MNRRIVMVAGFLMAMTAPLFAAESDFCLKHCTAAQLRKEIQVVKKSIDEQKATLNSPSSDKLATVIARKEKAKKHLAQHEAELTELKAQLESIEVK